MAMPGFMVRFRFMITGEAPATRLAEAEVSQAGASLDRLIMKPFGVRKTFGAYRPVHLHDHDHDHGRRGRAARPG
jgi:hypothetical protein